MLHILHVEDSLETRELIEAMLSHEMQVDGVPTLAAAQQRLSCGGAASYDVLLLDLGLPDARGTEVIEGLSSYGLPMVVLSSAMPEARELEQLAAKGAADYVGSLTQGALLRRIQFAHARSTKPQPTPRRVRMETARFDALKPYITCVGGSRAPFGLAG